MSFSKKILIIFGSVTVLLAFFAFLTLRTLRELDLGSDELIDDKMHIFSQVLIAVNDAKSLEAAGAHFLIINTPESYERFQASHRQVRETIQSLIQDPRFEMYKNDLEQIADHERKAKDAGAQAFRDRLAKKLSIEQAARITSRDGLPHVMAMQKILAKMEVESLQKWHETTSHIRDLHRNSMKMLNYAVGGVLILTGLFVAALWKILQQKKRLDLKKNQLLETEQTISRARKEAVEMVSHDLRSPLSSVKMCLDILEDANDHDRASVIQIAKRSVSRGLRLIERILDHTRIESGSMTVEKVDCDLKELLADQTAVFRTLCSGKEIIFEARIHESVERCLCDADRVCQVLSNLVGNALKFSNKGQQILLCAVRKDSHLEIEIRDQGPGIAKADADYIFDRYWMSATSKSGGTGLGLAISKAIIDAHGGKIWVNSVVGSGSSFYFTLPIT